MINDLQIRINEALEKSNKDYRRAHELAETKVVSESLGMYLKALAYMRGCCDIAKLFAEIGDRRGMAFRSREAANCLKEIHWIYSQPSQNQKFKPELARLALDQYSQAGDKCDAFLGNLK